jgi:hypothetical protein
MWGGGSCCRPEIPNKRRSNVTQEKRTERLKDRQAYRQALIQKREDTERKISAVEAEIKKLKA